MQYQVVVTGWRVWARSHQAATAGHTRQDAAILDVRGACEAALDMGQQVIRRDRLGVPQSARDVRYSKRLLQAG